jgi:hypothetical protein
MKTLSIRQPWAFAILHLGKNLENRSWRTSHLGDILIHAGAGCSKKEYDEAVDWMLEHELIRARTDVPSISDLPRGGIVGKANIWGFVVPNRGPYGKWYMPYNNKGQPQYGWLLKDAQELPFRPLKGRLGLFEVV